MSAKELKALVRGFFEEASKGKAVTFAAIDKLFVTEYVEHGGSGEAARGIKNYKQSMSEFYSAVPDVHVAINDMVVEGDKVAARFTLSGTHKGEFMGAPPTGKKVTIEEIGIIRIVGGKFVESWMRYDTLGLMQQLGLVPTSEK
jgi:predicted ester cyclase